MTTSKTRSLRKYEGDHSVVAIDPIEPSLEFFAPFGPLIAKTRKAVAAMYADGSMQKILKKWKMSATALKK